MLLGLTSFKCDECGKRFISAAVEWNATAFVSPMPCPKCGSKHTYPAGINNLGGLLGPGPYKKIWEQMDKDS